MLTNAFYLLPLYKKLFHQYCLITNWFMKVVKCMYMCIPNKQFDKIFHLLKEDSKHSTRNIHQPNNNLTILMTGKFVFVGLNLAI